jgi:hypothetical protein
MTEMAPSFQAPVRAGRVGHTSVSKISFICSVESDYTKNQKDESAVSAVEGREKQSF